jgi:archaellum component FlaG (FlaF/FlaG flagellin family)
VIHGIASHVEQDVQIIHDPGLPDYTYIDAVSEVVIFYLICH